MPAPPLRTVHLRRSPSPPDAAPESAAIAVDGGGGVDLARVGLALGLDPASVRLNGYFVSRGPGHVSTAVTWGALLAFFAARGLPTGADPAAPVAVRGRPSPSPPRPDPRVLQSSKRKSGSETENCSKKSKLKHNSSALSKSSEELLSDEITLGLKRRLRLDDMSPSKKTKLVDCNSVLLALDCQSMEQKHSSQLNSPAASSTGTESSHEMRRWSPHSHARESGDAGLSCRLRFCVTTRRAKMM